MGVASQAMGCGNSAQPSPESNLPKCWVASPDIYTDITPAEGPPPAEGLTYLDGCKLVNMKLAAGAKDKPCYHEKHYVLVRMMTGWSSPWTWTPARKTSLTRTRSMSCMCCLRASSPSGEATRRLTQRSLTLGPSRPRQAWCCLSRLDTTLSRTLVIQNTSQPCSLSASIKRNMPPALNGSLPQTISNTSARHVDSSMPSLNVVSYMV